MKYQIMVRILLTLLERRKVSASELARKYGVSVRTIYRYVDEMTISGVPLDVIRGSQGGIYISDAYKLPRGFFTKDEYACLMDALLALNAQIDDPVLKSAIQKISSREKTEQFNAAVMGNFLVDGGTWGDEKRFSDKLALVEHAVKECEALDVDYCDRNGERTRRVILPHLLVYKQNIWYVYAYCRTREAFRLFKIGRIRTARCTGEIFEKIPFSRDDVPLSFWTDSEKTVNAHFLISPETLPFAEEWLGVENVYESDGKFYADLTLPDDDSLVPKILSAGAGFRALSPASLAERVKKEAARIAASYDMPV